jgi:DNA-directed RNA polymerase subunit RPC12/RpoP
MSNFKFKNSKKIIEDSRVTLDTKHSEKINHLQNELSSVNNIDKQIIELKNQENTLLNDNSFSKFEKLHDIKIQIEKLEKQKNKIKSGKKIHNYFLKSGKIVFDYYSENTKSVSKQKKVNNFFNINRNNDEEDSDSEDNGKHNLIDKYMQINDNTYQSSAYNKVVKNYYECPHCKDDLKLINTEAILFCENCGYSREVIIDMIKPSYKDPPKEAAYFNYKRINHFNEWLAQFQAKETTEIPTEVFSSILIELKKQRINNIASLSRKQLREILKKLGLNKYYEHIPHIINRLNGIPAPRMTRKTEEKLRNMFKEIQIPFMKHCPASRKNFMSYSYVLHKFCELLELDDFLQCFPLLKSSEKLYEMDKIWKKICNDLHWEFIKSI